MKGLAEEIGAQRQRAEIFEHGGRQLSMVISSINISSISISWLFNWQNGRGSGRPIANLEVAD